MASSRGALPEDPAQVGTAPGARQRRVRTAQAAATEEQAGQRGEQHRQADQGGHQLLAEPTEQQAAQGRGEDEGQRTDCAYPPVVLQGGLVALEQVGFGERQHAGPERAVEHAQGDEQGQALGQLEQQGAGAGQGRQQGRQAQLVDAPVGHVGQRHPGDHLRPVGRGDQQADLAGAEAQAGQPGRPERIDQPLGGEVAGKDQVHAGSRVAVPVRCGLRLTRSAPWRRRSRPCARPAGTRPAPPGRPSRPPARRGRPAGRRRSVPRGG